MLPDFAYLRERVEDIEAIVVTHGHEDHLGALPWILRELGADHAPPVYGGALTVAMARSKLDEHRLREVALEELEPGRTLEAGPFGIELVHMTHSIPDASAVALHTELGTALVTGDYKFDQTPVDGQPGRLRPPRRARPGAACSCCAATRPTPTGPGPRRRSPASGRTSRRSSRAATGGSS